MQHRRRHTYDPRAIAAGFLKPVRRWLGALGILALASGVAHAEPATTVSLNGVPTPVFFNDGDSFRVLSGRFAGSKARLAGFNTLESYGKAHQWGAWSAHELFVIAKMATMHARRGQWSCTSDLKTDTYGRTLWWCPGLAEDLIRHGLAHVMSVTAKGGDPALVAAQAEAIAAKRGMWAHGVPDYILTSIHSITDDAQGDVTYNRMVSTKDGASLKWLHADEYQECDTVCDDGAESGPRLDAAIAAMKADPVLGAIIKKNSDYTTERLLLIASNAARKRSSAAVVKNKSDLAEFDRVLGELITKGEFGRAVGEVRACMIHVDFKRRFGGGRAKCLR